MKKALVVNEIPLTSKLTLISLALTNLEASKRAKSKGRVRPADLEASLPFVRLRKNYLETSRHLHPTSCEVEEKLSQLETLTTLHPISCEIEGKLFQDLVTLRPRSLFT